MSVGEPSGVERDEGPRKKTVLIRVEEWIAWLPQQAEGPLWMSSGVTGFEAFENEKLLEVAISSTGKQQHFSQPDPENEEQTINVRHGLYAFQAVLASNFDGPIPEGPDVEKTLPIVLPGHKNRETRRKEGKK